MLKNLLTATVLSLVVAGASVTAAEAAGKHNKANITKEQRAECKKTAAGDKVKFKSCVSEAAKTNKAAAPAAK